LGIFIQRLNPRAKALEPNQNKNARIKLKNCLVILIRNPKARWANKAILDTASDVGSAAAKSIFCHLVTTSVQQLFNLVQSISCHLILSFA
jgi:hypothetical protein